MKTLMRKLMDKLRKKTPAQPVVLGLNPLYPEKDRDDHCLYVDELNDAIKDERVLNIALTGNYGSGKSSILSDFEKKKEKRVIRVSLSTLGGGIEAKSTDDSERAKNNKELANSIQKEIVKQLLFREKPSKVPNSKYSRIAATNLTRTFLFSVLVAMFALLFIYYPWNVSDLSIFGVNDPWQIGVAASVFLIIFALSSLIILATNGKLVISKLTGKLGGGSITLAPSKNNNYFDEHLDEIVYFFEVSSYDIVILEDIERFNNSYIFETLRQLNALLNDSGQIRAKSKSIRFIYAIKDSLFNEESLNIYQQSTNRAKFFDLIIPVVPFITHQTGSDLMSKMFNEEDKIGISEDLISIVAKHITDMRLIKNIRNEYLVFSKKLLGDDKLEGLTKDKLFAMIIYKNTYLEDFESIKRGSSNLDAIYRSYRSHITQNIRGLRGKIDLNNTKINLPESIASRSDSYGKKLVTFIELSTSAIQANNASYGLHGINYTLEQMMEADFWEKIGTMGASDNITISYSMFDQYNRTINKNMLIGRADIERIVENSLDFDTLEADDKELLRQENRQLRKDLKAAPYKDIQQILSSSAEYKSSVEKLLGDGVALDLLSAGYIDVNFSLYTSIFHGTNPKAVNFVVHHLQTNKPDIHYKFNGEANIKGLLDKYGSAYLRDKSIYNIDILDYLLDAPNGLNSETHALSHISNNLAQGESEDLDLIDEYMRSGKHRERLIEILGAKWLKIFDYITETDTVDNEQRPKLFDAALSGSSKEHQYEVSEDTTSYVIQNADKLNILTLPASKTAKEKMGAVLSRLNAKLVSLERLSDDILEVVVENDLYTLNLKNLEKATKSKNLSLDNLLGISDHIFIYVADNLPTYLELIHGSKQTKHTVDGNESFIAILSHIAQSGPESLEEVIRGASKECKVENIDEAPTEAWSALLDIDVVPPTLNNLLKYHEHTGEGSLNQNIVDFLVRHKTITSVSDYEDAIKQSFAIIILINEHIDAEAKNKLVGDLKLGATLPINEIGHQKGDLYGLLVSGGIIDDSAEVYNYLKAVDVETRLSYIEKSQEFLEYIDSVSLNVDEINAISSDVNVSPGIKKYLLNNLTTYEPEMSAYSATNLASFALENNIALSIANLFIAIDGPDEITSVRLLNLTKEDIGADDLARILARIGKGYERLGQPRRRITLDDTDYNLSLVERVVALGMANTYIREEDRGKSILKINMKRAWQ